MDLTISTANVGMDWTPPLEVPVQLDHTRLQEILEDVDEGVKQAAKGEGRFIDDEELITDDE